MENKRNLKLIGGGVVASAVIDGAILAVQSSADASQFADGTMTQGDFDYMKYVSDHGKNYKTKTEYKMRQAQWAKTDENCK